MLTYLGQDIFSTQGDILAYYKWAFTHFHSVQNITLTPAVP